MLGKDACCHDERQTPPSSILHFRSGRSDTIGQRSAEQQQASLSLKRSSFMRSRSVHLLALRGSLYEKSCGRAGFRCSTRSASALIFKRLYIQYSVRFLERRKETMVFKSSRRIATSERRRVYENTFLTPAPPWPSLMAAQSTHSTVRSSIRAPYREPAAHSPLYHDAVGGQNLQ
jgi:hypothetical protein